MRLLLIGGSGFIGRSLIGYKPSIISDCISRSSETIRIENSNLFTYDEYFNLNSSNEWDAVIYLNNPLFPRCSSDHGINHILQNELQQLENFATQAIKLKRKFVYFSSGGAIYGLKSGIEFSEKMSCHPISHYGRMKLLSEQLLEKVFKDFPEQLLILRPSNPYGVHQKDSRNGVLMEFIRQFRSNGSISIYGTGFEKKDYIFIDDMLDSLIKLLESDASGIFNLGSGQHYCLNDFVQILQDRYNKNIPVNYFDANPKDVLEFSLNLEKLARFIDLSKMQSVEDSLEQII